MNYPASKLSVILGYSKARKFGKGKEDSRSTIPQHLMFIVHPKFKEHTVQRNHSACPMRQVAIPPSLELVNFYPKIQSSQLGDPPQHPPKKKREIDSFGRKSCVFVFAGVLLFQGVLESFLGGKKYEKCIKSLWMNHWTA